MQELKETESPSVTFWLKKATKSPHTERVYRYYLQEYMNKTGLDPEATITEWHNVKYDYAQRERFLDKHADLIERFSVDHLSRLTPQSRMTELNGILSFYRHSKIPVEPDIKERVYVVNHNRAISKEEIRRILEHATLRDKCFFLMMLESGLRPHTLVMIRYKHIKTDFEANHVPMLIELDPTMLKDNVSRRFTFIGGDGFKVLKEYLSPKLPLKDDDVIFAAVHTKQQKGNYLSPSLFSLQFAKIVRKLGLSEKKPGRFRRELNLYTLRKYFRNNIKVTDSAFREFWMGHTLGVDRHYFEANIEDPKTVEKHRREYAVGYPFLQVGEDNPSETLKQIEELKKQNRELSSKVAERDEKINEMFAGWKIIKPLVDLIENPKVQRVVEEVSEEEAEKKHQQDDLEAQEDEPKAHAEIMAAELEKEDLAKKSEKEMKSAHVEETSKK